MRQAASNGTRWSITTAWRVAHDGALGEHAGVGELERLLAADGERAGQAAEGVAAVGRLAAVAGVALAAVAERGEHDVVAHRRPCATPAPTASTTPAPSWPSTTGVGNGIVPSITDTSEWHSPARSMRTTTSPGPGSASRSSTSSRTSSSPVQTMPLISDAPSGLEHLAGEAGVGLELAVERRSGTPLTMVACTPVGLATSSGRRRWGSRGRTPCGRGRSCRGRRRTGRRRSRAAPGPGR